MAYDSHPPMVTAATFNCGSDCRCLNQPFDPATVVHAGGVAFCDRCGLHPHNQPYHACNNGSQTSWAREESELVAHVADGMRAHKIAAE